ncbi:MAG: DeoR/GlpR family DNA-binding transcription regulator [Bifidobacteriaceae bacterium]|nr:DeoR/GlpR family DNA-binding transcription regulator [Bifidobacteriaceae bacterium]
MSALLALLAQDGKVDVDQAVADLGVSAATIRRDLVYLDQQRLATRTRGGAVANSAAYDLPLRFKTGEAAEEKRRIAQAAASMAPQGGVVALNGGSTTLEVARALAARPDLARTASSTGVALTVVTNAVNLAVELLPRPYLKVVVTGGVVRAHSYELVGPLAERSIESLSVDTLFLGVNGFDPVFGASAHSDAEVSTNSLLVEAAARVVVVADSTKLGRRAFAQICPPQAVAALVTDNALAPEMKGRLEALGLEVVTV